MLNKGKNFAALLVAAEVINLLLIARRTKKKIENRPLPPLGKRKSK